MAWGWVGFNSGRGGNIHSGYNRFGHGHYGHGNHEGFSLWGSISGNNSGRGRYYGEASVVDPGYDRGSSEGGFFSNCWSKIKEFCGNIFGSNDRYGKEGQETRSGSYGHTSNATTVSNQDSPVRVKDTVAELDINGDGKISKKEFEINGTSAAYGANTQVLLKEGTAGNKEIDVSDMKKAHAEVAKALNDKVLQFATGGDAITTEYQRNAALDVFTKADTINPNGIIGNPELPILFKELGISTDTLKTPEGKLGALSAVNGFIQDVAALKFETAR